MATTRRSGGLPSQVRHIAQEGYMHPRAPTCPLAPIQPSSDRVLNERKRTAKIAALRP
jgi:hypothetical protein